MKISDIYGTSEWLKANSKGRIAIEGEPRQLTVKIARVKLHEFKAKDGKPPEQQITLEFDDENLPPLGLNKTNARAIAEFMDDDDADNWVGTRIELFVVPEQMSASGHAIRVREPEPEDKPTPKAKPAPAKTTTAPAAEVFGEQWEKATNAKLTEAGATVEELRAALIDAGVDATDIAGPIARWPKKIASKIPAAVDKIKGTGVDSDDPPF